MPLVWEFMKWVLPEWVPHPKSSVLNKYNQVWDCTNVYVTDGAAMTSSALCQPIIDLYMALTARAADHAVSELKRWTFKTIYSIQTLKEKIMDRREALRLSTMLVGGALSAGTIAGVMAGCKADPKPDWTPAFIPQENQSSLTELCETILPEVKPQVQKMHR